MRAHSGKLIIGIVVIAILVVLSRIVWLPDVLSGRRILLGEMKVVSGDVFTVSQFWNDSDFYTVEFRHLSREGPQVFVIDPDAPKIWTCQLRIKESTTEVDVYCGGRPYGKYNWVRKEFITRNGVTLRHFE